MKIQQTITALPKPLEGKPARLVKKKKNRLKNYNVSKYYFLKSSIHFNDIHRTQSDIRVQIICKLGGIRML